MPNLYIIASPIGNLEDMTLRALRVLKEVDIILCEDTRESSKLLSRYEISKRLISYHHHTKLEKLKEIVELLQENKNLALLSDAGTPGISDPGNMLVRYLLDNKIDVKIIPIPGACALTAALSISGFKTDNFVFLGFPPHKKGRKTYFENIASISDTIVFYESPYRIRKTIESLIENIPKRDIAVMRELTKLYETTYRGKPIEILSLIPEKEIKGEFVIVVNSK